MLSATRQHGHYRPDMVTRTSVIEPYDIQQVDPVEVARHTIDPFIYGVRAPGPAVAEEPSATAIAYAAAAVVQAWREGKSARVRIGNFTVKVSAADPVPGGLVGKILNAAHGAMNGRPVLVRAQGSRPAIITETQATAPNASNVVVQQTGLGQPMMQPTVSPYHTGIHSVRSPYHGGPRPGQPNYSPVPTPYGPTPVPVPTPYPSSGNPGVVAEVSGEVRRLRRF